jgi:hypothetical protein
MAGFRGKTFLITAGAAMLAVSVPAIGAANSMLRLRDFSPVSLQRLGSIASFTPSIRDDKLSSAYAKAALAGTSRGFRFTPTSGSLSGRREITILVRADSSLARHEDRANAGLGITPLAFNLDASRGWRKFALPESVGRKPLDPVSTDIDTVKGFSLASGSKSKLKAGLRLDTQRDVGTAPQTLAGENQYRVDANTSYSLTRNLNVTAGVRLAGPDNRLTPLTDQRQDNQAVYFGTIFKF